MLNELPPIDFLSGSIFQFISMYWWGSVDWFFISTVITQMPNLNPNYCICLAGKYSEVWMYCGTYQYTIYFAIYSGWKFAAHIYASWSPIFL